MRGYRSGDLEALWRLDQTCFAAEFRFDREGMRSFAELPGAVVVIAEQDGEGAALCGFVIVHLEGSGQALGGYVVTLDVAMEWRRQGLAGLMLAEAERLTVAAGASWMGLHVFVENAGAIAFYERAGYVRGEMLAEFYGDAGMDSLVFRKWLGV
ncbi:hypothetical protein BH10ACI4_BH10ACI4_28550 [soil metagenome]